MPDHEISSARADRHLVEGLSAFDYLVGTEASRFVACKSYEFCSINHNTFSSLLSPCCNSGNSAVTLGDDFVPADRSGSYYLL